MEVRSPGERRCPSCGALVGTEAEWCGQCFSPLAPAVTGADAAPARGGEGAARSPTTPTSRRAPAAWPCPVCDHRNPIEAEVCGVCGTPFARLFEERARPDVDPRTAVVRSLLFPGLGHAAAGRGGEGIVRGGLFAWTLGMALLFFLAWGGAATVIGGLYAAAAVALYALSALEARRLADGEEPLVTPRALLWATVTMVMASALLVALTIVGAARR